KLLRSGVRQFGGSMDRQFEADGLRCRISLSMPDEPKRKTANVTHQSSRIADETLFSRIKIL
ncbi:MAG: hypothetical protein WAN75_18160, partial [Xanthobacteraceae bacterium]